MLYDKKWDQKVKVVDEIGQVMLKAAEWLEQNEWCQCMFESGQARCLTGVLNEVHPYGALMAFGRIYAKCQGVMSWNDTPGRTKQEVINMLREVAYT